MGPLAHSAGHRPSRRGRRAPVVHHHHGEHHHGHRHVDRLLRRVGDPVHARAAVHRQQVGRAAAAAARRPRHQHGGEEVADRGPNVGGGDHGAIQGALQPPRGEGHDELGDAAEEHHAEEVADGVGHRRRRPGQVGDEPAEAGSGHEHAHPVVRPAPPGEHPGDQEGQPAGDVERGDRARRPARALHRGGGGQRGGGHPEDERRQGRHPPGRDPGRGGGRSGGECRHGPGLSHGPGTVSVRENPLARRGTDLMPRRPRTLSIAASPQARHHGGPGGDHMAVWTGNERVVRPA